MNKELLAFYASERREILGVAMVFTGCLFRCLVISDTDPVFTGTAKVIRNCVIASLTDMDILGLRARSSLLIAITSSEAGEELTRDHIQAFKAMLVGVDAALRFSLSTIAEADRIISSLDDAIVDFLTSATTFGARYKLCALVTRGINAILKTMEGGSAEPKTGEEALLMALDRALRDEDESFDFSVITAKLCALLDSGTISAYSLDVAIISLFKSDLPGVGKHARRLLETKAFSRRLADPMSWKNLAIVMSYAWDLNSGNGGPIDETKAAEYKEKVNHFLQSGVLDDNEDENEDD